MSLHLPSLYKFSTDENIFGGLNPNQPSWFAWSVLMKVYDGLALNERERVFFKKVTGGLTHSKGKRWPQNWMLIIGRGGGKTRFISRVIPYRALTFREPLHPGQRSENVIISPTLQAGMTGFEYIEGMFLENELLYNELHCDTARMNPIIKNSQMAHLGFKNRNIVRLTAVTRISGRGRSIYTLIMEEGAHFKTDGRFSDEEVYRSARPAMARFGEASICFVITTPWTKDGLVWKVYKKYFGVENDEWLVVQGSTKEFNPSISDKFLANEEASDPMYFQREYLARFVDSQAAAFSADSVEACTVEYRQQLPPQAGVDYFGYIDPASLSQSATAKFNDEFWAGVAHTEDGHIVMDAFKTWVAERDGRRYTPDDAITEAIELLKRYDVLDVQGDKYDSGYIEPKFTAAGFKFEACPLSKSDLYLEMIPLLNDGRVELLDDEVTNAQFKRLERRRRARRDTIDHVVAGHDDRSNGTSGLAYMGAQRLKKQPGNVGDVRIGERAEAEPSEYLLEEVVPGRDAWGDML